MIADLDQTRGRCPPARGPREAACPSMAEMLRRAARTATASARRSFHVPPSVSLLRLHSPAAFGDGPDAARGRWVTAVKPRSSAAQGLRHRALQARRSSAWRPSTTRPANHIGSFEFGLEFGPLLDQLKAIYGLELTLYVEEKTAARLRQGRRSIDLQRPRNRVSHFIRYHSTKRGAYEEAWLRDARSRPAFSDPGAVCRARRTACPYCVLLVPLRNGAGEFAGRNRGGGAISAPRAAAAGQSFVLADRGPRSFAIVLMTGAIVVVIRGLLLRPLDIVVARDARWRPPCQSRRATSSAPRSAAWRNCSHGPSRSVRNEAASSRAPAEPSVRSLALLACSRLGLAGIAFGGPRISPPAVTTPMPPAMAA